MARFGGQLDENISCKEDEMDMEDLDLIRYLQKVMEDQGTDENMDEDVKITVEEILAERERAQDTMDMIDETCTGLNTEPK